MRRGLVSEVESAFAEAIAMCGCMHPDERDVEEERLTKLRDEVLSLLREGDVCKQACKKLFGSAP